MKKILRKPFGVAFVVALLLCMIPIIPPAVRGQPPAPSFWVEPATETFTTDNASVGTLFNVTVWGSSGNNTLGWAVQLGFDSSELQAVAVDFGEFFAGHTDREIGPEIDNVAGTVLAAEILLSTDYVGPTSGSLFNVTFEIIAGPTQGQSLTSLIDPSYGISPNNMTTLFVTTSYALETPLSTAPCAYTYRDSAAWSPNPTFVTCSPNPIHANSPVNCTAVVSSLNATGTVTWTSNSSTGSFSPSVCTLSSGTCSTTYTDSSPGTVVITASYSGDTFNAPSNGSTILEIAQSSTYVYCYPNPVHYDEPVNCYVMVYGANPTGTVTWSSNSSTGSFSSSVCTLSSGYCSTTYTDSSPGTVTITASYSGDSFNAPSNGSAILEVNSEAVQSSTYAYCLSSSTYANSSVTCFAGVSGFNLTGTVTWSSNSSTGSFSPSVCTLSSESSYGYCSTTYTDSSPGTVLITAVYSGDSFNAASNASTILEVEQCSTYVYCYPNPVHYNGPVNCYVTVNGFNPTGTVTWSSNSSTGSFSSSVCTLSSGYCSTTYTDSSVGTVVITAVYSGDSFNAPSNDSTILEVNSEAVQSSTYVYCSSSSTYANSPVTCTAEVSGFNLTGTVTWTSNSSTGSFSPSVCTLSSGTCSTTYTDSSPGTVVITASYSGDSFNAPSNGSTILEVTQCAVYVYCYPNPVHYNGPVNCYVMVYGANPTGTVTWSSNSSTGSFDPSVCTLSSEYCWTTYTDSSVGTVVITAVYSGDSFNAPSNDSTILEVNSEVVQSSTYVYCYPNPVHYNGPVSCTATVYGANPTGTVTWSSNSSTGSFSSSVCTLSSESSYGYCSTVYTDSSPGTVVISASYSGDSFNAPSNGSDILEVNSEGAQSSTYVSCYPNPVHYNGPVSCTATVYGANPTGTVTWSSNSSTGSFSSSVCTLSSGYCSTTYTDSSVGTVVITAVYSGDSFNAPSNGSDILEVNSEGAQSSTYVSCYPNPVHYNGPVSCTATVYGANPTGTVTWSSNSSTGSFSSSVCTLSSEYCWTTYTDSSVGTVVITAVYSGDSFNAPSNGSDILEVNSEVVQSSTYVYCYPNPVHYNGPVNCYVTVNGFNPTGTVTWSSNSSTGSFSSSVCTLSSGYCSTTYTDSSVGTVVITAVYSGDSFNAPSNGSDILEVNSEGAQSSTYVYCSTSSTYANSPVTCTVTVNGGNPSGTVTWSSNSSTGSFDPSVCTLSNGYCSTTYTDSSPGTVTITASYSGDTFNAPSSGSASLTVMAEPVLPPEVLLNVPYHHQTNGYYCGPAALEEVFDFYGPDVSQGEIANVARTTSQGTYDIDIDRAAQFSSLSSSEENYPGVNLTGFAGYSSRSLGYAALYCYGMSIEDLKSVLAAGYPVMVLTTWHFRVAVGYTDEYIIFQDPYYGSLYEMTYDAFYSDWYYSGYEGILVCPWQVTISNPSNVKSGDTFTVSATITYPEVYPFQYSMSSDASMVNATITIPSGLALAPGETAQKTCAGSLGLGQSFTVSWQVQCQATGDYRIDVEADGLVSGYMMPEPPTYTQGYSYQDRIGGTNESTLAATLTPDTTPPVTIEDYNGSWQNHAFAINLTASDDMSGVLETYYKINGGPEETLSVDGEPVIATPGANNTLEYWSVDWAGNQETHEFLANIKLDETPPVVGNPVLTPASNIQPHQGVLVTVNATDLLSGVQNVTLLYSLDNGVSWTVQAMTLNPSTLLFGATIPGQPAGTLVRFDVTACDQAGNTATVTNGSSDFTCEVPALSASMTCTLEPLNLGFRGQWLTFCLTPPEGYSLDSINVTSLVLNGSVQANPDITKFTTDENGVPALLVCFNRTLVSQFVLSSGVMTGNVTLSFAGRLSDGSLFEGVCTFLVRMPGDINMDGKVDMKDVSCAAVAFGSRSGHPGYKVGLDENEDGRIDLKDIALIASNFGKTYI